MILIRLIPYIETMGLGSSKIVPACLGWFRPFQTHPKSGKNHQAVPIKSINTKSPNGSFGECFFKRDKILWLDAVCYSVCSHWSHLDFLEHQTALKHLKLGARGIPRPVSPELQKRWRCTTCRSHRVAWTIKESTFNRCSIATMPPQSVIFEGGWPVSWLL